MILKDILSNFQAADIEDKQKSEQVNNSAMQNNGHTSERQQTKSSCRNCGGQWPHSKGYCPAKGEECRNCSKLNHFAKQCRSLQDLTICQDNGKDLTTIQNTVRDVTEITSAHLTRRTIQVNQVTRIIVMSFTWTTTTEIQ